MYVLRESGEAHRGSQTPFQALAIIQTFLRFGSDRQIRIVDIELSTHFGDGEVEEGHWGGKTRSPAPCINYEPSVCVFREQRTDPESGHSTSCASFLCRDGEAKDTVNLRQATFGISHSPGSWSFWLCNVSDGLEKHMMPSKLPFCR